MLRFIFSVLSLSVVLCEDPIEYYREDSCDKCSKGAHIAGPVYETVPNQSIPEDTALLFDDEGFGVITFLPDMSSLTDKFSFCLWIRKIRSGNFPVVFTYKSREFVVKTNRWHRLFRKGLTQGRQFTAAMGAWYHHCGTWSSTSRTFTSYIDGRVAGHLTTPPGKRLPTGGTMVLGDYSDPFPGPFSNGGPTNNHFGGEMYNFNMFSKELTADEVAELSAEGLCTQVPEQLEDYKVIKWGEILRLNRRGTVREVNTGCAKLEAMEKEFQELEENCG